MLVDCINSNAMLAKMKEKKLLEDWQVEDAARLRQLFDARTETVGEGKLISQMEFGAKYGIGSQGMVWQYLNAHRPLNIKAAKSFATGLKVNVVDFSPQLAAQISDAYEVSQPVLSLVTDGVGVPSTLQPVSAFEAELLAYLRAVDQEGQRAILTLARSIALGRLDRSDDDKV